MRFLEIFSREYTGIYFAFVPTINSLFLVKICTVLNFSDQHVTKKKGAHFLQEQDMFDRPNNISFWKKSFDKVKNV